jgi:hypothetical protein
MHWRLTKLASNEFWHVHLTIDTYLKDDRIKTVSFLNEVIN